MIEKDQKATIFKLREMTGVNIFECKKTLIRCDWDIDKAAKYLKHLPSIPIMDHWLHNWYCFCSTCDRFYDVPRTTTTCYNCGNKLEPER